MRAALLLYLGAWLTGRASCVVGVRLRVPVVRRGALSSVSPACVPLMPSSLSLALPFVALAPILVVGR